MAVTALMERTEPQPRTALPTSPTQPTQPTQPTRRWTINSSSKSVDRNATNQTGLQPYRFIISLTVLRFSRLSFALFRTLSVSFDHKIKRKANGRQKKKR